jgi:hypothetical protein
VRSSEACTRFFLSRPSGFERKSGLFCSCRAILIPDTLAKGTCPDLARLSVLPRPNRFPCPGLGTCCSGRFSSNQRKTVVGRQGTKKTLEEVISSKHRPRIHDQTQLSVFKSQ